MSSPATGEERLAWLRLARTDNVGPVAFDQMMRRCGSARAALEALPGLARRGGRIDPLAIPSRQQALAELEAAEAIGARLIIGTDPDFPAPLRALDPPPPLIVARGDTGLLRRSCVAIVGARIASAAGQRFARQLALDLGQAGQVIVSGLARGIDRAAHEGSLASGTVAVLGGGVDDVYPPEHAELYACIAERGCVISESPMGHRAQARDFPRRNRLVSGLSRAVVVVEAELKSGSLITARLAAEQGREVLAVPGSPLDPRAKGTNDLLRQGAALCEGAQDVLRALEGISQLREGGPAYDPESSPGLDDDDAGLRERVGALLSPTPVSRDDLIRAVAAPAPAVLAALIELALAGRADLLPGGMVTGR